MEIIKGYTAEVRFPVPAGAVVTATVSSGNTDYTPVTVTTVAGVAVVSVPYSAVQEEHDLEVAISFVHGGQNYSQTKSVSVVTPLLDSWEIEPIILGDETSVWEIEKAVRHVINAHTGQSFGKFTGTKEAVGNGDNSLSLPARLLTLTDFRLKGSAYPLYDVNTFPVGSPQFFLGNGIYDVTGDGWYIKALSGYSDLGIKADNSDYEYVSSNGVISAPRRSPGSFQKDLRYTINGVWGYEEVPEPVREAAKLLINDYAASDGIYRDRYLESLTSPDWRIQFHSGAFRQTGNVRADQLLSDYVLKRGWAVI